MEARCISSKSENSKAIPVIGVFATCDPRIDPSARERAGNIVKLHADKLADAIQLPDGRLVPVVYSDLLIDTEKEADKVARSFIAAGVTILVGLPDTWAFPQLTLLSLLAHFPKDTPLNFTCGNSGPKPGVVFAHAVSGAVAQSGRLMHLNVGSWPDDGLKPEMTAETFHSLVDWLYAATTFQFVKGKRVVVFGHDSMGMETALQHIIPIFVKNRTHALDLGMDYSVIENNYIYDQRDYLGGNSGANTTEPIQIISFGKHNVIRNNYITSGSVMIRMQGDTNLVAGNYLGYPTIRDTREMVGHALAMGNTWAGNWGRGNFPDTNALSAAPDSESFSLTVPADLGRIRANVLPVGGYVDSNKTEQGGIAGANRTWSIYVFDTSGTDEAIPSADVDVQLTNGTVKARGTTVASGLVSFTVTDGDWWLVSQETGFVIFGDTITVSGNRTDTLKGYNTVVGTPASASLTRCYGYVVDIGDNPLDGVQIIATLNTGKNQTDSTGEDVIITDIIGSASTDSLGYFFLDLKKTAQYATTSRGYYDFKGYYGGKQIFEILKVNVTGTTLNLGTILSGRQ